MENNINQPPVVLTNERKDNGKNVFDFLNRVVNSREYSLELEQFGGMFKKLSREQALSPQETERFDVSIIRREEGTVLERLRRLALELCASSVEYSDQIEFVEATFAFIDSLINNSIARPHFRDEKAKMDWFRSLTQDHYLITDMLINVSDKNCIMSFWTLLSSIAHKIGLDREFHRIKHGIVSQVAVYKLIKALGQNPHLSHPDEDAFDSLDMWIDNQVALQIKGGGDTNFPEIFEIEESDLLAFPSSSINLSGQTITIASKYYQYSQQMLAKKHKFEERTGKKIRVLLITIPYSQIDPDSGEPSEQLIAQVKDGIKLEK